jgi:hypothetical protein
LEGLNQENKTNLCHEENVQGQNHSEKINKFSDE